MSDMFPTDATQTPRTQPQYVPGVDDRPQGRGWGWSGKTRFAGIWLVLLGVLNLVWALTALIRPENFAESNLTWDNLSAYGYIFLIIGAIQAVAGYLVLTKTTAGRALGVIISAVGIVLNFFAIGAHPQWSLVLLVMN